MESNWAADNLQVIRTLMERTAVYRRALAPIMIYNGLLGITGGVAGWFLNIATPRTFVGFWTAVGVLGLAGSLLLVRRQALKENEPFWSPPTRRVAQGFVPPLFAGSISALLALLDPSWDFLPAWALPTFWILLYGCALSAAGFFMHRGIKLLGWIFILGGCALMASRCCSATQLSPKDGHLVMGGVFGGLHLAYGLYLYFTEQRRDET
ncbi:MAG TPA: hypothetical protein VJA21_15235 [Verrucomicrobiae bacterium]